MDLETHHSEVVTILERLGAAPEQAEVMARQLLKRATQRAKDKGTSPVAELGQLLHLTVSGRQGIAPTESAPAGEASPQKPPPQRKRR